MRQVLTISEIMRILFETENTAVVNSIELTNKQAREFFNVFNNHDKELKVITEGAEMFIWLRD